MLIKNQIISRNKGISGLASLSRLTVLLSRRFLNSKPSHLTCWCSRESRGDFGSFHKSGGPSIGFSEDPQKVSQTLGNFMA